MTFAALAASSFARSDAGSSSQSAISCSVDDDQFNRAALELDLPMWWQDGVGAGATRDGTLTPREVALQRYHSASEARRWFLHGDFTPAFVRAVTRVEAIARMRALSPPPDGSGDAPTSPDVTWVAEPPAPVPLIGSEMRFMERLAALAATIDSLDLRVTGLDRAIAQVDPADTAQRSFLRLRAVEPPRDLDRGGHRLPFIAYPFGRAGQSDWCRRVVGEARGSRRAAYAVFPRADSPIGVRSYRDVLSAEVERVARALDRAAEAAPDGGLRTRLAELRDVFLAGSWDRADWSPGVAPLDWLVQLRPVPTSADPCGTHVSFGLRVARRDDARSVEIARLRWPTASALSARLGLPRGATYSYRPPAVFTPILEAGSPGSYSVGETVGESSVLYLSHCEERCRDDLLALGRRVVDPSWASALDAVDERMFALAVAVHEVAHQLLHGISSARADARSGSLAVDVALVEAREELDAVVGAVSLASALRAEASLTLSEAEAVVLLEILRQVALLPQPRPVVDLGAGARLNALASLGLVSWEPGCRPADGGERGCLAVSRDWLRRSALGASTQLVAEAGADPRASLRQLDRFGRGQQVGGLPLSELARRASRPRVQVVNVDWYASRGEPR